MQLGQFPSPIERWEYPVNGASLWIKRDDMCGLELSGNKVRKLEFLLADAVSRGFDSVITIGGVQSNHARATAICAAKMGMEAHLILRSEDRSLKSSDFDPGMSGNLLPTRLSGADIWTVTWQQYADIGQASLLEHLAVKLIALGKNPYVIPVGGSNGLGTWGYLAAVEELKEQIASGAPDFDEIVVTTGSGGTLAGIALGVHLAGIKAKVRAFGVNDTPEWFYKTVEAIWKDMGLTRRAKDLVEVTHAKGRGYSIPSPQDLAVIADVMKKTGVLLDPCYTGKAFSMYLQKQAEQEYHEEKKKVLFWHTGGIFGCFGQPEMMHRFARPSHQLIH